MKDGKTIRNWFSRISDVVSISSAIIAIAISALDFAGLLGQVYWLDTRIPALTLLSIGLVLTTTVIDRHVKLAQIERLLERNLDTYALGVQYLDNISSTLEELQDTARKAEEFIMAIGSKSRAVIYLQQVAGRADSGEIIYYRLLTGDHITHELHIHLVELLENPSTHIAWNRSEKYGNLTVSENQAVFVLPSPYWNKFTGIKLPGERNARLYSQYFLGAFHESVPIDTARAIEVLCEQCSPSTSGDAQSIEEVLLEELTTSVKGKLH